MEEKYVAILYEKIVYDVENAIFVFKPIEVISDCTIDFTSNILTNKVGKSYLSMEDEILAFSEENLCYGYPLLTNDLEEFYPDSKDQTIKDYYESLLEDVVFGVYDKELGKIKIILASKEELLALEDDNWFFEFEIENNDVDNTISISKKVVNELLKNFERQEYDTIKNYLSNLQTLYDQIETGEFFKGIDDYLVNVIDNQQQEESFSEDLDVEEMRKNVNEISEKILGIKDTSNQKEKTNKKNIEREKLDELIGLHEVKDEVNKLVIYLNFMNKTKDFINLKQPNLHMLFTGNPGTGKTTVARIISGILYEMGYLKNNKFAEITPKDLIAGYVGQTAIKTAQILKQYNGGLIFIDEAYVFASKAQEFAQEAIVEIIKEMEKQNTVFVFAGYKDEMKEFVKSNPGLSSRIGYYINYEDYTNEELYQIFELKVKKANLKINDNLKTEIIKACEKARGYRNFGNGRFIDKLFMKILLQHSINTNKIKAKSKLKTLTKDDITNEMVDKLIYENNQDMFNDEDKTFEKVIGEITEIKTDQIMEDLITKVILDKLYDESYDRISSITDKKMKELSPQILGEMKKTVTELQKVKTRRSIGFSNKRED